MCNAKVSGAMHDNTVSRPTSSHFVQIGQKLSLYVVWTLPGPYFGRIALGDDLLLLPTRIIHWFSPLK